MNTVLYHVPGYKPREHACEPGEEKGLLNLLDESGAVIVRGVPLYEDPSAVDGKPAGYCSPAKVESDGSDKSDQSDKAKPPKAAKRATREYTLKETDSTDQGILGS